MALYEEEKGDVGSRRVYVFLLLSQTISYTSAVSNAKVAIENGGIGHIICYSLLFIFLGVPTIYMELTVGQFTARDCLDMWKARPCLTHVGYLLVLWQIIILFYTHATTTFVVHYLLISFENPVPFYICGRWATKDCQILNRNYTLNKDCLRTTDPDDYCDKIYTTYPEYQYWRNYVLGGKQSSEFYIAWRVCVASALICVAVYIMCFKRIKSVSYFIGMLTIYPILGYLVTMLGSMMQKGIVNKYEEALDCDFSLFGARFRFSNAIQQVMFSLGVGTGVIANLSSSAPFRSPCYANSVITTVVAAAFATLTICTTAMMTCPYSYEYGIKTDALMHDDLFLIFEKIPRLLSQYEYRSFYLILMLSSQAVLGIGTILVYFFSLMEMLLKRNSVLAKYPGLLCLAGIVVLFICSIPMLGSFGINIMVRAYRRYIHFVSSFITTIEGLVFIFWYGYDKFSEDVHFMQGLKPNACMKIAWILSSAALVYSFGNELYHQLKTWENAADTVGVYALGLILGVVIVMFIGKILIAACRRQFLDVVRLDFSWGPRSEVLRRSRAMFTGQAMTKEYMYRQYHLQAGIKARQRRSNARASLN